MAGDTKRKCPPWIDELTETVGECFETGLVPVAYDVWGPDVMGQSEEGVDLWMVHFYPSLSELVGGPKDGTVVYPSLKLDIMAVLETFESVADLTWSSRSKNHEPRYDGSVLDLSGSYCGHQVLLRIFDAPPDDCSIETVIDQPSGRLRHKDQPPE